MRYFKFVLLVIHFTFLQNQVFTQITPPDQDYMLRYGPEKWIQVSSNILSFIDTAFTIEAWIYPEIKVDGNIISNELEEGYENTTNFRLYSIEYGKWIQYIQTLGTESSVSTINSSDSLEIREWNHVAVTASKDTIRLYINGVENGKVESPGNLMSSSNPIIIGKDFHGLMKQVRIWNRSISADSLVYYAGKEVTGNEFGLLAVLPMDEGQDQITQKQTKFDFSGILGLSVEPDNNDPIWVHRSFISDTFFIHHQQVNYESGHSGTQGALIDFDSDGDLDFIFTINFEPWQGNLRAYRNNGTGYFEDATMEVLGTEELILDNPGNAYRVSDYNGDGLQDVFVGCFGLDEHPFGGALNRLLIQTSSGQLVDESDERLPPIMGDTHGLAVGDIDNDGDVDIFLIEGEWIAPEEKISSNGFYINDGNGYFTQDLQRGPEKITGDLVTCAIADVDNDNDLDLYLGTDMEPFQHGIQETSRNLLCLNDGKGYFNFAPANSLPVNPKPYYSTNDRIIAEDINNDNWIDFLETTSAFYTQDLELRLFLNNRNGTFRNESFRIPDPKNIDYPRIADFNNDNLLDIITPYFFNGVKLYINNGNTQFINASALIPDMFYDDRMAYPGDLDNDGDIDILLTTTGEFDVYINQSIYNVSEHFEILVPEPPIPIYPVDKGVSPLQFVLDWDTDLALEYRLQVAKDSSFQNVIIDSSGILVSEYYLQNLDIYQTYYWRVKASNTSGECEWTPNYTFTSSKAPIIISPDNNETTIGYPVFCWHKVHGALSYNTLIACDKEFTKIVLDTTITDTCFLAEIDLPLLADFYFKASVNTNKLTSVWSDILTFRMFPDPPDQDFILEFLENDVGVAPISELLLPANEFTMEFWVKIMPGTLGVFIGKAHNPFNEEPFYDYIIDRPTEEVVQFQFSGGTMESYVNVEAEISLLERWYHIAGTLKNDTIRLYINGELMGEERILGFPINEHTPFSIGNLMRTDGYTTGQGITGWMAQVRIWDKALSSIQITEAAGEYLDGSEQGLIAYWPLDDGKGQIARDLTANALDLMLGTTSETDENDPEWIANIVPPKPSKPFGSVEICQMSSDIKYATTNSHYANSYIWSIMPEEAGIISGTDTIAFVSLSDAFLGKAKIFVKGINDYGEGEFSDTLLISVIPLPYVFLGNDTIITESIELDAGGDFTGYLWSTGLNTQTIRIDTSFGKGKHEIYVIVTDSNNCMNTDTILITIDQGDYINLQYTDSYIRLYPNPTTDFLNIEIYDINENVKIDIISQNGIIILTKDYKEGLNIIDKFDLKDLKPGWYIIKIQTDSEIKTNKFLLIK